MDFLEMERIARTMALTESDDKFVVSYQSRHYYVSEVLFITLKEIVATSAIQAFIRIQETYGLSEADARNFQASLGQKLLEMIAPKSDRRYIQLAFTLVPAAVVQRVSLSLCFLFRQRVWPILLLIALCSNAVLLVRGGHQVDPEFLLTLTSAQIAYTYALILVAMMCHELGHATATASAGRSPSEIGAGVYMVFPVLFANVSVIWQLPRLKRIGVNLAGIYFQLLFNAFLLIAVLFTTTETAGVLSYIAHINLAVALYVLIPFLRNDGYWVLSDYLDIPNLNELAYKMPYRVWRKLMGDSRFPTIRISILLYSVSNYLFLAFSFYLFLKNSVLVWDKVLQVGTREGPLSLFFEHPGLGFAAFLTLAVTVLLIKEIGIRLAAVKFFNVKEA